LDAAIAHIELGPVSRAHDAEPIEFSITEGPTIVCAKVFDGVNLTIDDHDQNESVIDLEGLRDVGLEFGQFANVMKRF
jgi:hypothetical protein